MSEADDYTPSCAECGTETARRNMQTVPIHVDNPDGGYDVVDMPVCDHCRGKLHGYDCARCGLTHDEKEGARYCCRRRPGEAPDCRECGRRMERVAHGMTASGVATVEFAICEGCGIAWGKYTGWHYPDDEEDDDREPRADGGTRREKVTIAGCPAPGCLVTKQDLSKLAEHVNDEHPGEWDDPDWPDPKVDLDE